MYTFIVENAKGIQLQLAPSQNYILEITSGLLPPSATINTSPLVNADGEVFNSSKMNMRNLVLMIYPQVPIEANRIALYQIFKSKQYVKCYFQNDARDVYIEGYVENVDGSLFDQMQCIQVSILCPQPYWLGLTEIFTEVSKITDMLEFPFWTDGEPVTYQYGQTSLVYANASNGDKSYFTYDVETLGETTFTKNTSANKFAIKYTAYLREGATYQFTFISDVRLAVYVYSDELWGTRVAQGFSGMTFTPDADGTYVIGIYVTGNEDVTITVFDPEISVVGDASVIIQSEGIPFSEYNQYATGTVLNDGDIDSGMIVDLRVSEGATITNPIVYNANTNEFFGLTGSFTLTTNNAIRINSIRKTVQLLENSVVQSNLLSRVKANSTWLMARNGENMFYYRDDNTSDVLYMDISFTEQYEGV